MKVDINEIFHMEKRRNEINNTPLKDIQWFDGDEPLLVMNKRLASWDTLGLDNVHFAITDFLLKGHNK